MFVPNVAQVLNQNGIKFLHIFILWVKGLLNVRIAKKQITAKESSGIIMVRNSQVLRSKKMPHRKALRNQGFS
jgi:hypothetical protein